MKKAIKLILSILICYLGMAFIKFDMQWYQCIQYFDEADRILLLFAFALFVVMFYCVLSLIELEF